MTFNILYGKSFKNIAFYLSKRKSFFFFVIHDYFVVSIWISLKFCHLVKGEMEADHMTLYQLMTFYPITMQCCISTHWRYKALENIVRKGEIACNKQFLLFSQCFPLYMTIIFHFKCTLKMLSAICFNLDQSKVLSSCNGLIFETKSNYKQ